MGRQSRRNVVAISVVLMLALSACGAKAVSPSTYVGSPDSPDLILEVDASQGDTISQAKVTRQDDQRVVVEVRIEQSADEAAPTVLEAPVRLDSPLAGREVVDQEGRAIPQA